MPCCPCSSKRRILAIWRVFAMLSTEHYRSHSICVGALWLHLSKGYAAFYMLCHQRMHHLEMVLTKRKAGSGDKIGPNQPLALSWEMLVILFRSKECGDQTFCLTYIFSHCLAMLHLSKGYAAFYMLCHQRTHHLRKLGMCQII